MAAIIIMAANIHKRINHQGTVVSSVFVRCGEFTIVFAWQKIKVTHVHNQSSYFLQKSHNQSQNILRQLPFSFFFWQIPLPYFNDESMYKWGSFQLSKYQQNIDRGWRVGWGVGVKNCLRIFVINCRLKVDSNMGSRNYGLWEFMHYHPCNYFFVINVKFLLDKYLFKLNYLFKLTPEKSPYTLFQCFYCQSC